MNIEIRNMKVEESEEVRKIGRKSFIGLEKLFFSKPKEALLALHNGNIIGGTTYKKITLSNGKNLAYIEFAFVKNEYAGQGIGKLLYLEVTKLFKNKGYENSLGIVSDDNVSSWKLFQSNDYIILNFKDLLLEFGFLDSIKIWYESILSFAVGYQLWMNNIKVDKKSSNVFLEYLLLNFVIFIPKFFYLKNFLSIFIYLLNIYTLLLIPLLAMKIFSIFNKRNWIFNTTRGGLLISIIISISGGFFPIVGRFYPNKYEKNPEFKKDMGQISLVHWLTLFTMIFISYTFKEHLNFFNMNYQMARYFLLYVTIPVYPFESHGGKRIWLWNRKIWLICFTLTILSFIFPIFSN